MKKILPIKTLWQRNPQWSTQRLGTVNGSTIGSDGCVITSASMLYTYYGKTVMPNQLDDFLTDNNFYLSGNLFSMTRISAFLNSVKLDKMVDCKSVPAPIADIKSYIDQGKPVFVWVNQGVEHCTLAVGYEDDQIIVNDPWIGDQVKMNERWGDSATVIIYVNFFSGPVPSLPNSQPPMDENIKRKSYFFDLIWHSLYGSAIDTDKVTEADVKARNIEAQSEKYRSGEWDKLVKKAGISGATDKVTFEFLYQSISKDCSVEVSKALQQAKSQCELSLAEQRVKCRQETKNEIINKIQSM